MECSGTRLSSCSVLVISAVLILVLIKCLEVTLTPYVLLYSFKISIRPLPPQFVEPANRHQQHYGSDKSYPYCRTPCLSANEVSCHYHVPVSITNFYTVYEKEHKSQLN